MTDCLHRLRDGVRCRYLCMAVAVMACGAVHAADIHLTLNNGIELKLHDDHTWSCTGSRTDLNNMTVAMEDGREIQLGADGRWAYLVDENSKVEGLSTLFHTGNSRGTDAKQTVENAKGLALAGISKRLVPVMPAGTPLSEIRTCVEEMDKLVEHEEKLVKGEYDVKVTVRFDKEGINAVKECVELGRRLQDRMDSAADSTVGGKR